jgi:hypothetical protein
MQWCFLRTRISLQLVYIDAFVLLDTAVTSSLYLLCLILNTCSLAGTEANWCEDAYLTGADAEAQMAAVMTRVQPAGCVWESAGTADGKGCIKTAAGVRASAATYKAAKALLPSGFSLVSVLGNRRGMSYNAFFDDRRHFEVALVHFTPLLLQVLLCIVLLRLLVPPVVHFVVFVHVVITSTVAAFVHFTHLSSVLVVCIVAHHLLVPLLVHVVSVCTYCHVQ